MKKDIEFLNKEEARRYAEMRNKVNPHIQLDTLEIMLGQRIKYMLNKGGIADLVQGVNLHE